MSQDRKYIHDSEYIHCPECGKDTIHAVDRYTRMDGTRVKETRCTNPECVLIKIEEGRRGCSA